MGSAVLNVMLKNGDVISIGNTSMTLVVHASAGGGGAGAKKFERTMPARAVPAQAGDGEGAREG